MRLRLLAFSLAGIIVGVSIYSGMINTIKEYVDNYVVLHKDPAAWNNRGIDYMIGKKVPQNYSEAVKWFQKAAEQGDTMAQRNLGLTYTTGTGVTQNHSKAMKWFRKAAEKMIPSLNLILVYSI